MGNRARLRLLQGDRGPISAPPIVDEVLAVPGRPLDSVTRGFVEPRLGYDFSGVRVHDGARADAAAAAVGARAFTVGADVVFRKGELAPNSTAGQALMVHELAHVVQQGMAPELEHQAVGPTSVGHALATDLRLDRSSSGVALQRQEQPPDSCDDREPDFAGTNQIIENAYGGSRKVNYRVDELRDAWFHVRNQRERGGANCCSPELAAAEHYLYARYSVVNLDYSPFEMKAMIWGYGYLKFLVPRTGICPKSPDTQGSRDWGYRGADEGATNLFFLELAQNDGGETEGDQAEEAAG